MRRERSHPRRHPGGRTQAHASLLRSRRHHGLAEQLPLDLDRARDPCPFGHRGPTGSRLAHGFTCPVSRHGCRPRPGECDQSITDPGFHRHGGTSPVSSRSARLAWQRCLSQGTRTPVELCACEGHLFALPIGSIVRPSEALASRVPTTAHSRDGGRVGSVRTPAPRRARRQMTVAQVGKRRPAAREASHGLGSATRCSTYRPHL